MTAASAAAEKVPDAQEATRQLRLCGALRPVLLLLLALAPLTAALLIHRHRAHHDIFPKVTSALPAIRSESGNCFIGTHGLQWMSSHNAPSSAELLEDGRPLMVSNAPHDDIRALGRGRYSFWHDSVYFSASDNSSPLTNGRRYEMRWPLPISAKQATAAYVGCSLLSALGFLLLIRTIPAFLAGQRLRSELRAVAFADALARSAKADAEAAARRAAAPSLRPAAPRSRSLLLGIAIAAVTLLLLAALIEGGFQLRERLKAAPATVAVNRASPVIPGAWDAELAWHYQPNSKFDYWAWDGDRREYTAAQEVNSFGFTDREPPQPLPSGARRIMILGDSFIEALQIENRHKVGALLERDLEQRLKSEVVVASFGGSGTGQAAQYAYWKKFAKLIKPQLLILNIVSNDPADNHPQLSARVHGWDPLFPPRHSVILSDSTADGLIDIPPYRDWSRFTTRDLLPPQLDSASRGYALWSATGRFFSSRLARSTHTAAFPWNQLYKGHHVDFAFMADELSADPYITEGYEITARLLRRYKREAAAYGAEVILLFGDVLPVDRKQDSTAKLSTMHSWFRSTAREAGIEMISIPEHVTEKGLNFRDFTRADSHWNEAGHRLAADLLLPAIEAKLAK